MRKELILLGLLTICGITYTHAVRTERLNLKGGVIVEGHIVSQNLGQSVTFSVERTYATVNSSWVAERTKEVVKSSSLNDGWKTWAEENFGADIKSDITLSRIRIERIGTLNSDNRMEPEDLITAQVLSSLFNNKTHQVYEFEEGAYVRFVDLTTALHTFNLSDIHSIEYKERKDSQINGIVDVIEVKSGEEYKGQIIEKVLGKLVRIKTNEGIIRSILYRDIDCQKKEGLNPDLSILKQAEYLDKINDTVGLIIYQKNDYDNPYIIIKDNNNGEERQFKLKEVDKISSYKNEKYEPIFDIKINANEVYFNKHEVLPILCKKNKKGLYVLQNDRRSEMIVLRIDSDIKELTIEMANTEDNKSAILFPVAKSKENKQSVFVFSDEDVLENSISADSEFVSKNNTLRKEYKVEEGFYALYVPKSKMCYLCELK